MQRLLLISLVALSYLLLAGGPRWTLAPIAAVPLLLFVLRAPKWPANQRSIDLSLLAILAALAIQIVPLPLQMVTLLSPHTAALANSMRLSVGGAPAFLPLSVDPEATAYAMATTAIGIAAFWCARGIFADGGVRQFCRILGLLAAIAAVAAVLQRAVTPRMLMGIVASADRSANPIGPFLNRNHFAAWQLMAAALTSGYLVAHFHIHPAYRQRFRQAFKHFLVSGALLTGLGVLAMIGSLLLTLSRSAAVGLGAAALCGGWLGRSRLRFERSSAPTAATLAGVAIILIAAFIDIEGWFSRLQQSMDITSSGWGRLTIWEETLPIIRDFPTFGTGAGTYGAVMGQYQQTRIWVGSMQDWALFNNAHSHYFQILAEGGVLLTVPVVAACVSLLRLGLRSIYAEKAEILWVRAGAAAGLVGIAVQSIWEVPLMMTANAVLAGVLAGVLLHQRTARGGRREPVDTASSPLET